MKSTSIQQLYWDDIKDGDAIPTIMMEIPYKKVVMTVAATWDYMPGHHNPQYAQSQGQKTIYLNTFFFQGFADRVLTEWAGPQTFIAKRKLMMVNSVYAEDTVYGEGIVTAVYIDDLNQRKIDCNITLSTENGVCSTAQITTILPSIKTVPTVS
jgi:hypothetical protein